MSLVGTFHRWGQGEALTLRLGVICPFNFTISRKAHLSIRDAKYLKLGSCMLSLNWRPKLLKIGAALRYTVALVLLYIFSQPYYKHIPDLVFTMTL